MHLCRFVTLTLLTSSWIIGTSISGLAQDGEGFSPEAPPPPPVEMAPPLTQSDITGPNPVEMVPNQSDVTGPNPVEMVPNQSDVSGPNPLEGGANSSVDVNPSAIPVVDLEAFQTSFLNANIQEAITLAEELFATEMQSGLGITLYGATPSLSQIRDSLSLHCEKTGERVAVIYAVPLEQELQLLAIFPDCDKPNSAGIPSSWRTASLGLLPHIAQATPTESAVDATVRQSVPEANQKALSSTVKRFKQRVSDPRQLSQKRYLPTAQKLYQWLVQPLEADLQENEIDTLVFTMGSVLRPLPIGALHDGEQFLIERYNVAQIPSFGLTDTRLGDLRKGKVLAMGASQFDRLSPLPSVPAELETIIKTENIVGESYLNQDFTLSNFIERNQKERYSIIHLATHGEFRPGSLKRSFIQFWDTRLTVPQLQNLATTVGWKDPQAVPVELFVLSACKTAVGDTRAELGFAGLSLATGIKSSLASLWYISDLGTLMLMSEFYQALGTGAGKAQALRKAQLELLQGNTRIEGGKIITANGQSMMLPPELSQQADLNLTHPYFWSSFMLFGNWY